MGPKIGLDMERNAIGYQDEDIITSKDVQSVEREGRISTMLENLAFELSASKKNLISYNENGYSNKNVWQ